MANDEQLAILRKGVKAWNAWRREHPNLKKTRLGEREFRVESVHLLDLKGVDLAEADLKRVNFSMTHLTGANLSGADLRLADLTSSHLSGSNMKGALIVGGELGNADLTVAHLASANFSDTNLTAADLSGSNLSSAKFRGAFLSGTDFSNADLSGADFVGAVFRHTRLRGANLHRASVGSSFCDIDLSEVKGLDTLRHDFPSTVGIDTIYFSKGKIPESFLRGAGVPDNFITFAKSLTAVALEFYSCFISYSSADQAFAERLYADLQAKGVRCWYAPEDMKIGDEIRPRIDKSIRLHDKLLIVLSKSSIGSWWVKKEVETTFEREAREKRPVLFPIRLDNDVMETDQAWAADIRRTRHIGNFTGWQDQSGYVKAFERLIRDLKADAPTQIGGA
jgi:uncharacterized protein YjbI with pentapeptide repeats